MAAHKKKVESMKAARKKLEKFAGDNTMMKVKHTKQVVDCLDSNSLPSRYNSLSLPSVRSGFGKMPLHNECRLHKCKPEQCMEIKRLCNAPYVDEGKELPAGILSWTHKQQYTCVDKVAITSSNPMSLGFGMAWCVIGAFMVLGAMYINMQNGFGGFSSAKVLPYQPSD